MTKMEYRWIEGTANQYDKQTTRNSYRGMLKRFWEWYVEQGKPDLNVELLNQHKQDLIEQGRKPGNINNYVAAIRSMTKLYLTRYDIVESNTIDKLYKFIKQPNKKKIYKIYTQTEIIKLIEGIQNNTEWGLRDRAMIAIIQGAGLRANEVASLKWKHYHPDQQLLHVEQGKGGKDRVVPLPNWVLRYIDDWKQWYEINMGQHMPMFIGLNHYQRDQPTLISRETIWQRVRNQFKKAGLDSFPHEGRANYITRFLQRGGELGIVSQLAGHADTETTLRYDQRGLEEMIKMVKLLDENEEEWITIKKDEKMVKSEIRSKEGRFNKPAIDLATETELFVNRIIEKYSGFLSIDAIMAVIISTTMNSCTWKIAMETEPSKTLD